MLLKDATQRASVHLFLRTLQFPFPPRDLIGVPGDLFGFADVHPEVESALLVHELEHLNCLMYPLGPVLTSLALRANDLGNEATKAYKHFMEVALRTEYGSAELDEVGLDVVRAAATLADHATVTLSIAELLLPLLEGLALSVEMEVEPREGTWTWATAVALEYRYRQLQLALTNREVLDSLRSEAGHAEMVELLSSVLVRQIEASRKRRFHGDLLEQVFRRRRLEHDPVSASPYFFGYLFLRRLFQTWSSRNPELRSFGTFFNAATRLFCGVLPLTLLDVFTIKDRPFGTVARMVPPFFSMLLNASLNLPAEDLSLLGGASPESALLKLDWKGERLRPLTDGDGADHESIVFAELLVSVFGARDVESPYLQSTLASLRPLFRATFLVPVANRFVVVTGVDPEYPAVLVAEPSRGEFDHDRTRVSFDQHGASFVPFADAEVFKRFSNLTERAGVSLPEFEVGKPPYHRPVSGGIIPARLLTYCHFWPGGVPELENGEVVAPEFPIDICRLLIVEDDGESIIFPSTLTPGTEARFASLVQDRDWINQALLHGISQTLEPEHPLVRYILDEVKAISAVDSMTNTTAELITQQFALKHFLSLQRTCRKTYVDILFPRAAENLKEAIPEAKLQVLAGALTLQDWAAVRRWLRGGMVLAESRRYSPRADEDPIALKETVGRVRTTALRELGIPLVAWHDSPPGVVLDLVPDPLDASPHSGP